MAFLKKRIFTLPLLFLVVSCGTLDRSFVDQMDRDSDGLFVAGKDFSVVGGDTGEVARSREEIQMRTPASERGQVRAKNIASIHQELTEKEENLSEEDTAQYQRDRRFLPTDSDKLYYLSLKGDDRIAYITNKKEEVQDDKKHGPDIVQRTSVHGSALFLGMPKEDVVKIWGRPSRIEIAGNPKNQNERWSFFEDGSVKQVYFEGGKVQGWALDL